MLKINHLNFQYDLTRPILKNLNLEVAAGELFGLIGPNGAGKSTLIRLVMGILKPSTGEVSFRGHRPDISSYPWRRNIGFVGGSHSKLLSVLTLSEHIALYRGLYAGFREADFLRTLEEFKLLHVLGKHYSSISFGERILFEILLTIHCNPTLLLLDEPTVGVDVIRRRQINEVVRNYISKQGAVGILTSHNLRDITEVSDHGAFLSGGNLIQSFETKSTSWSSLETQFEAIYG